MFNFDQFIRTGKESSDPQMKIQSNNVWFNRIASAYPEKLQLLVKCFDSSVLRYALNASFTISMMWLSLACSTVVYVKDN